MSTRTCADCGARNAEGAPWCTQCYTPFGSSPQAGGGQAGESGAGEEPAPDPARGSPADVTGANASGPVEGPTTDVTGAGASAPAAGSPTNVAASSASRTPQQQPSTGQAGGDRRARPSVAAQRDIRQLPDGGIEWRCVTCERWNALEVPACVTCGTPRRGFGSEPEKPSRDLDEDRLVAASILLPGLGHLRAGQVGSGAARAVFAVGWLVGGLLLLLAAARAGRAYLAAVPLLAGAAVVWVLTVLDVRSLARGVDRERLDGRALLWLMAGVTGLLVLVLMLDTWRLAA